MTLKRLPFVALLGAAALFAQAPVQPGKTHLKIGDTAPDFELNSSMGKKIKLSDYRGKKTVVLAFFPAAFTGGWTKELTGYQAGIQNFNTAEAQVLAVSTDNQPTLNHWAGELHAEYPLLSDFQRKVSTEYGVLIPAAGVANRTTFVIDTEGKIQHIDEGKEAIDITGAVTACSRLKKK